jgi:hypothetical protein
MDLTNASAIITGDAGGFSSATVRRLAQNRLHRTLAATAKQVCATGTLRSCSSPIARLFANVGRAAALRDIATIPIVGRGAGRTGPARSPRRQRSRAASSPWMGPAWERESRGTASLRMQRKRPSGRGESPRDAAMSSAWRDSLNLRASTGGRRRSTTAAHADATNAKGATDARLQDWDP